MYLSELKNVFVQIKKSICPNKKDVFVQINKYICPNWKVYLFKSTNEYVQFWRRPQQLNLFGTTSIHFNSSVKIWKCIWLNKQIYLSKLTNVIVQMNKCIWRLPKKLNFLRQPQFTSNAKLNFRFWHFVTYSNYFVSELQNWKDVTESPWIFISLKFVKSQNDPSLYWPKV